MNKITNKCLWVGSIIENTDIQQAKDFLKNHYGSAYSTSPHITFSLTPLPEHNIEKAIQEVDLFLKNLESIVLTFSHLEFDIRNKFISLIVQNDTLLELHTNLTTLLDKYRDGFIREKDHNRIKLGHYNKTQLANIKQFGFARVFSSYQPHITIGNIVNGQVDLEEVKYPLSSMLDNVLKSKITIKTISIGYYDDSVDQSQIKTLFEEQYKLA
jgi:hypothetical protein